MNSLHTRTTRQVIRAAAVALLAVGPLAACSTSETIVAVNVASSPVVGAVSTLEITIDQANRTPLVKSIQPPSRPIDGGRTAIKAQFYERVTLPEGWSKAPATVSVKARDDKGVTFSDSVMVEIEPEGAVAAFLMLGGDKPDAGADAGAADAAADASL